MTPSKVWILFLGVLAGGCLTEAFILPLNHDTYHVLILDAGSTGTRANYFTFKRDPSSPLGVKITGFKTAKVTPGVSAFVGNDEAEIKQIQDLIQKVSPLSSDTELELQATAGMRIVQVNNRDGAIHTMNVLREMLQKMYGDKVHICENCVRISTGQEEGLYTYVAVNYLLGNLGNPQKENVGVVEIGGASMQIVLPKPVQGTCDEKIPNQLETLLRGQCVYARSFIPYGSEMGTHMFLNVASTCVVKSCNKPGEIISSSSPCFHPDFKRIFNLGATDVHITGKPGVSNDDRYAQCYSTVESYLENKNQDEDKPKKVKSTTDVVYLMGGNVAFPLESQGYVMGATIYLKDIRAYAKSACASVVTEGKFEPFFCLNLVYLAGVLEDAYGFAETQKFVSARKIQDVELEWSVGAAVEAISHHVSH